MTSDALSMTFATLFAAQVESRDLSPKTPTAAFYISEPESPVAKPTAASLPGANDPSKRLLLTGPPGSTKIDGEGSNLARLKRDRRFPRQVELVIYNTERIPRGYLEDVLQRVFHESAGMAAVLACQSHIHRGPYPKDIARMKADSVREDAKCNKMPVPVMRYVPARSAP